MADRTYNVLFVCTGNSARSIMAESLLTHWGARKFKTYSAGTMPKNDVDPLALDLLRKLDLPVEGLHSKNWHDFALPDAPVMDFIFTLCDQAARQTPPMWPGKPVIAHWGVPDPALVAGSEIERRQAFRDAFRELENRIKLFASLRVAALGRLALKRAMDEIGGTHVGKADGQA
jgi:protein-tyrosine-phosphatase